MLMLCLAQFQPEPFLRYALVLYFGCSHGSSASHRKLLPLSKGGVLVAGGEAERGGWRESERNISAYDMKPQMQICLDQCAAAIACKAAHSCC